MFLLDTTKPEAGIMYCMSCVSLSRGCGVGRTPLLCGKSQLLHSTCRTDVTLAMMSAKPMNTLNAVKAAGPLLSSPQKENRICYGPICRFGINNLPWRAVCLIVGCLQWFMNTFSINLSNYEASERLWEPFSSEHNSTRPQRDSDNVDHTSFYSAPEKTAFLLSSAILI